MAEATKTSSKKPAAKSVAKVDPILKQLLEAGAHFGHRTARWNPKMAPYIFGERGGVHIIDLTQTATQLATAEKFAYEVTKAGGQILFVGTKRQAKMIIEKYAHESGMPFVTHRWLGGMLTNLDTIKNRIQRLKKLEAQKAENDFAGIIKKEKLLLEKQMIKLFKTFDGVRDMHGVPAALFVVDMPKEDIALLEARKLGLPVIAMADTNADPDMAEYLITSNDDAIKAIDLITGKIAAQATKGSTEYKAKAAVEQQEEINEQL
ncbi:30S ribosomal protein S2 [Candidatus Saccharibacteria bacterium]|nr:30S ribosomal protein S2 [Candidatus Saccharibacteria bacterium]